MWTTRGGPDNALRLLRTTDEQRCPDVPRSLGFAETRPEPKPAGTRAGREYRRRLGAGADYRAGSRILAERVA